MILDHLDRRLLDAIQSGFPIVAQPFQALAESLGADEADVLSRVHRLHQDGIIREMGAVFDLKRLGHKSTLCAAEVAPDFLVPVVALINGFPEITHNYQREHRLNVWFTVIASTQEEIDAILDRIRSAHGVAQVISLPQRRMFKISVHFQTSEENAAAAPAVRAHKAPSEPHKFEIWEMHLVRVLSEPMPISGTPFADMAARAGVPEALALERIQQWVDDGTIRRFGARVAHHAIGYAANGMSVWNVNPDQVEAAGQFMAAQPEVSHCYLRDVQPGWNYNLYGMIHGATTDEVEAVVRRIAEHTCMTEYAILFSTKEFKKTAPRYFANIAP
jgi:siroheme decarboxylase